MEKVKALKTMFDEQAVLHNIEMVSRKYKDPTVILAMSKSTMDEIEKQCGVQYPVMKYADEIAYGKRDTISKYMGYTVLQNNELPFGEVKIMIEVY